MSFIFRPTSDYFVKCSPLEVREDLRDVLHPGEVVAAVRAHKLLDERTLNLGILFLDGGDGGVELGGAMDA